MSTALGSSGTTPSEGGEPARGRPAGADTLWHPFAA
ncbi:MAG: hypothetical protein QOC75_1111, partial [Pseudonocardiales bacterium]|nr:hypothetical protein [Pseudonocardiales bacterium]